MCIACTHTIHRAQHNFGWNKDFAPAVVAKPGETIHFECMDSSGGQLGSDATLETLNALDFGKINPVSGPVYIEGAKPGDALKVTLRKFIPSGVGWTANIPGFGLLADQFTDPALHVWSYDANSMVPALYGPGGRVPLKPFSRHDRRRTRRARHPFRRSPTSRRRQHGHPRPDGGGDALSARRGRRRAVFNR